MAHTDTVNSLNETLTHSLDGGWRGVGDGYEAEVECSKCGDH
jgi:hypothetical protein